MMELTPGETALVVAGAWNAAILTPEWVLKHGLDREGEARVRVFIPAGAGAIFEFPRYSLDRFSYVVRPDALAIAPLHTAEEDIQLVEDATAKMLEALRHTPVTGVGHNFEFRENELKPQHASVFTRAREDLCDKFPAGWDPAAVNIHSSFKHQETNVIVNISRILDAGTISVKFNFHHPIATIDQALDILRGHNGYSRMWENFTMAQLLMQEIYGVQDVVSE
jgi:hypothetical protein